jgi:DNA-directed RNA polymerase subunit E'/Rpb7
MDNIYTTSIMSKRVQLFDTHIGSNIDDVLMDSIRSTSEGTCLDDAYIKPGSCTFISKSAPRINGRIISFEVTFKYESYRPMDGAIIKCTVVNVTKAGIRAEIVDGISASPAVIFINRDHYYNDEMFSQVKESDIISVTVINSRCERTDTYISIIAQLNSPDTA